MTIMVHPNASERMHILGPHLFPITPINIWQALTLGFPGPIYYQEERVFIEEMMPMSSTLKILVDQLGRSTTCKHQSPRTSQS